MFDPIEKMPCIERPYEKFEKHGPVVLSDAELLSILLRTGTKNKSCLQIAAELLEHHQEGLVAIHHMNLEELQEIQGIGRVKAIQLKALSELTKRLAKSEGLKRFCVNSPKSIAQAYMEEMRYYDKEHIKIVFLNTKNAVLGDEDVSIGTVNASLVDPREIFKLALKYKAVQIIMLHNHPSGEAVPSQDDIDVTKRLVKAGHIIGIEVIDHIVIGDGRYLSFREQGLANLT